MLKALLPHTRLVWWAALPVAIEAEIAFALASAYQERFGGMAMSDIHSSYDAYMRRLRLAAR